MGVVRSSNHQGFLLQGRKHLLDSSYVPNIEDSRAGLYIWVPGNPTYGFHLILWTWEVRSSGSGASYTGG